VGEVVGFAGLEVAGVAVVLGGSEAEIPFLGGFEGLEEEDSVFAEEATIAFLNVGISSGSIGAVVDYFAFGGDCSIDLHNKINIIILVWIIKYILVISFI
jgi:hypothetical protein